MYRYYYFYCCFKLNINCLVYHIKTQIWTSWKAYFTTTMWYVFTYFCNLFHFEIMVLQNPDILFVSAISFNMWVVFECRLWKFLIYGPLQYFRFWVEWRMYWSYNDFYFFFYNALKNNNINTPSNFKCRLFSEG